MASANYTAKDITVLEGLEPVRKRPGMYIGGVSSAGLHHLVWEVLDNAIDEAMNGYASNVRVTLMGTFSFVIATWWTWQVPACSAARYFA